MYPINRPIRMPAEFEQDRGFRKSLAIPRYKCFTWNFCFLNTAETDTPQLQSRSGESLSGTDTLGDTPVFNEAARREFQRGDTLGDTPLFSEAARREFQRGDTPFLNV